MITTTNTIADRKGARRSLCRPERFWPNAACTSLHAASFFAIWRESAWAHSRPGRTSGKFGHVRFARRKRKRIPGICGSPRPLRIDGVAGGVIQGAPSPPEAELIRPTHLVGAFCLDGQITQNLSSPPAKIFRLSRRANQRYQLAPSFPGKRGVSRSSRTRERMRPCVALAQTCHLTSRARRDRR
jgi:hypothetical protein